VDNCRYGVIAGAHSRGRESFRSTFGRYSRPGTPHGTVGRVKNRSVEPEPLREIREPPRCKSLAVRQSIVQQGLALRIGTGSNAPERSVCALTCIAIR
jgi:hypothetical protein